MQACKSIMHADNIYFEVINVQRLLIKENF